MGNALRDTVAKAVAEWRPTLLYYKADPVARKDIRVTAAGNAIDIIDDDKKQIVRISKQNAVYMIDMINSFAYYFGSARPVRLRIKGQMYEMTDFSTPRLHDVAGFEDFSVLCPSLTEPYMTTEQYLDFAELKTGDVVIDLGSYSALTSIAFSKAVGTSGKVIAVEPDPLNFSAAEVNIQSHRRVNGFDNITLIPAAVSDKPGFLNLSSEGAMGSALTSIVGSYRGETVRVECVTLQGLVDRFDLPKVDFIKMDIEGAELATLLGSREFLVKYRPKLIIEPHLVDGVMSSDAINPFLTEIGYTCETIEQTGVSLPLLTARPTN